MQNWNDELNDIMEKKMKDLAKKDNGKRFSDNINTTMGAVLLTLNDSNFDRNIKKSQLIVVDFCDPWCEPCRADSRVIEQLATELARKALFGKLYVDENPLVSSTFGIQSIPTIAIFKNGK